MSAQTLQRDETAKMIARLVGSEGMPVRLSDEADPHVTTDDWGKVLVVDYDIVKAALNDGVVIRDPENGFLKMSAG
jgi:hypothetical protein